MNIPRIGTRPASVRDGDIGISELIALFPVNAIMAEIGVYKGDSAKIWLNSGKVAKLYCVDPWMNHYNDGDVASHCCDMAIIEEYFEVAMKPYVGKFVKVKKPSLEAAQKYPDLFFDVIYIDANHAEDAVCADIQAWMPKVKIGGIMSGHDYRNRVKLGIDKGLGRAPEAVYRDTSWMVYKR